MALAVQRENEAYVGYTILELDWAYSNARLIARPDSDWLTPSSIEETEEDPPSMVPGAVSSGERGESVAAPPAALELLRTDRR